MLNRAPPPQMDDAEVQEDPAQSAPSNAGVPAIPAFTAPAAVIPASASPAAKANSSNEVKAVAVPPPAKPGRRGVALDDLYTRPDMPNAIGPVTVAVPEGAKFNVGEIALLKVTPHAEGDATLRALLGARKLLESGRVKCLATEMNFDVNSTEALLTYLEELENRSDFHLAHIGSLDYSELEITDRGSYPAFLTDSKQLQELFETYKRIRSFDERSGFRVYSGSLSLDRKGNYFDYTDLIFACKGGFPTRMSMMPKGNIRFKNGAWWLENPPNDPPSS
jgi:hypothetical protein